MVSMREMKAMAMRLAPAHPLRILLRDEPDEMEHAEFASKVLGCFRLLRESPSSP
jgi:hypothetical protein